MYDNSSIGTYFERELHLQLKLMFEPDSSYHEIHTGRYIADILKDDRIFEIQTRQLYRLKGKLEHFCQNYSVTVVYPVITGKKLCWIDPITGEISTPRKSPRKVALCEILAQIYPLREFLGNGNVVFCAVPVTVTDYRLRCGYSSDGKKGSRLSRREPVFIGEPIYLSSADDYRKIVPVNLPGIFTSKDFAHTAGLRISDARSAINVLGLLGIAVNSGKTGHEKLYSLSNG